MNDTPKIRFNEFTDEWEQCKFSDITFPAGIKNKENLPLESYSVTNENGFIPQKEQFENGGSMAMADKSMYYIVSPNSFAYNPARINVGSIGYYDKPENVIVSSLYEVFRTVDYVDDRFLWHWFRTNTFQRMIERLQEGGVRLYFYYDKLCMGTLMMPRPEEQRKIGAFIDDIDNLIALHQHKYEQIINVKKSMLGRLFPYDGAKNPQIRFRFSEDWEEVKLGDIIFPYSDPVETPNDGYTRLGIRSHGKGTFHDYVPAGQELGTAQMHRVAAHKFIVNITFGWEHAVAITNEQDAGKLVSHRFPQFSMTDSVDDNFLKYVILDERFKHHLFLSSPGGAGRNRVLNIPQMFEYKTRIPKIEEQRQVAEFLNSVNNLIDLYAVKVQKLKQIKSACLDKMFI